MESPTDSTSLNSLKSRSAQYLNYLIACAAVNVFAFLGTAFYMMNSKKSLVALKESNPDLYETKLNQVFLLAGIGFGIAMLAVAGAVIIVLKRGKLMKQIQEQELALLDDLDIK